MRLSTNKSPGACLTGIKGPGCSNQKPLVTVEPRTQCFQFTAANQPSGCENSAKSTWVVEYDPENECIVYNVWGAYHNDDREWTCTDVQIDANKIEAIPLKDSLTLQFDDGSKALSSILTVEECDVGWIQAVDSDGCNARCYKIAGRLYCR